MCELLGISMRKRSTEIRTWLSQDGNQSDPYPKNINAEKKACSHLLRLDKVFAIR